MKTWINTKFLSAFLAKKELAILLIFTLLLGCMDLAAMKLLSEIFESANTQYIEDIEIYGLHFSAIFILATTLFLRFIGTWYTTYTLNSIIFKLRTEISGDLLKIFLENVDLGVGKSKRELWKKLVYNESNQLIAYIKPILQIIFDLLLSLIIIVGIASYFSSELLVPVTALLILITFITYLTFPKITQWGEKRQIYDGARLDVATYAIENHATLQISRLAGLFVDRFRQFSDICVVYLSRYNAAIDSFPLMVEVVLVIGCVSLLTGSVVQEAAIAPLGYAALKLLPLVKRVLSSAQRIKYGAVAVEFIRGEYEKRRHYSCSPFVSLIDVNADGYTTRSFALANKNPDDEDIFYPEVNFPQNGLVVICGQNGVGKSTWLQAVAGFSKIKTLLPEVSEAKNIEALYVPQNSSFAATTATEIMTALKIRSVDFTELMRKLDMSFMQEKYVLDSSDLASFLSKELSGGQIQRFEIGLKLQSEHGVFLLDEPTSEQETSRSNILATYLREVSTNKLIICITHDQQLVGLADVVYVLARTGDGMKFSSFKGGA